MIDILYEDNHCLVINKPAGMLSQGDSTGDQTVLDEARAYLKQTYAKPGNVYVGLVHRLDRPTSGVLLLAKTSKAASRLSQQFREGRVQKTYLAIVEGTWADDQGQWSDWLIKDESTNVVSTVRSDLPGAQPAQLNYRVVTRHRGRLTVELRPLTGRGHQIRVQLASRGLPIVGDRKYGATSRIMAIDGQPRIALHASRLEFRHPTKGELRAIDGSLPADWPDAGP